MAQASMKKNLKVIADTNVGNVMAQENKMKKKYNKYRTLKGFDTKSKAQDFLTKLGEGEFTLYSRQWKDKDKNRFYVRQLVKKGRKRDNGKS